MKNKLKNIEIKKEAEKVALELIEHAKETARQMLLTTNLDVSQIPLICNKIIRIQSDLAWVKMLLISLCGGVGVIFTGIIIYALTGHTWIK